MHILRNDSQDRQRCSFCGRRATGLWKGTQTIFCCWSCAESVLPALAADSIPHVSRRNSDNLLRQFELRFWRAISFRFMKDADDRLRREEGSAA